MGKWKFNPGDIVIVNEKALATIEAAKQPLLNTAQVQTNIL